MNGENDAWMSSSSATWQRRLAWTLFACSGGSIARNLEDCRCHYPPELRNICGFATLEENKEADSRRSEEMRMAYRQRVVHHPSSERKKARRRKWRPADSRRVRDVSQSQRVGNR